MREHLASVGGKTLVWTAPDGASSHRTPHRAAAGSGG